MFTFRNANDAFISPYPVIFCAKLRIIERGECMTPDAVLKSVGFKTDRYRLGDIPAFTMPIDDVGLTVFLDNA